MNKPNSVKSFVSGWIRSALTVLMFSFCGVSAIAQETQTTSSNFQAVAASPIPVSAEAAHFDAQYEDNGIKVLITKVFPAYQMKDGQLLTTQTILMTSIMKEAGFAMDAHRVFHVVSRESVILAFTPILAGNRAWVAKYVEHENSNAVFGSIGAVAMFALTRGASGATSTVANLNGLESVSSTGMLASANFKDQANANTSQLEVHDDPNATIYIANLSVGHIQNDKSLGDSILYFVIPKEMKGEVLNGNHLASLKYGSIFTGVLGRAVVKAANLTPAPEVAAELSATHEAQPDAKAQ